MRCTTTIRKGSGNGGGGLSRKLARAAVVTACLRNYGMARGHKWRRLHPDKPSYTILAQMHRDLSEWIHPKHDRWITVREAARLQSFHDGFVFMGSEWQQLKQVGNAVPPLMGLAIAHTAADLLETSALLAGR